MQCLFVPRRRPSLESKSGSRRMKMTEEEFEPETDKPTRKLSRKTKVAAKIRKRATSWGGKLTRRRATLENAADIEEERTDRSDDLHVDTENSQQQKPQGRRRRSLEIVRGLFPFGSGRSSSGKSNRSESSTLFSPSSSSTSSSSFLMRRTRHYRRHHRRRGRSLEDRLAKDRMKRMQHRLEEIEGKSAGGSKSAGGGKSARSEPEVDGEEEEDGVIDPILLTPISPDEPTFVFTRPNGTEVTYRVESLIDYMLFSGRFTEPETNLPFEDCHLEKIDSIAHDSALGKRSVLEAKHSPELFSEKEFQSTALVGLERCAGELVGRIPSILENSDCRESAQVVLLTELFPFIRHYFEELAASDIEFAEQCLSQYVAFIHGPKNHPVDDAHDLLPFCDDFLEELANFLEQMHQSKLSQMTHAEEFIEEKVVVEVDEIDRSEIDGSRWENSLNSPVTIIDSPGSSVGSPSRHQTLESFLSELFEEEDDDKERPGVSTPEVEDEMVALRHPRRKQNNNIEQQQELNQDVDQRSE